MALSTGILRTRVARRVLLLFVLCALGPVTVLSAVSYTHVRGQLEKQSRDRLAEVSKNAGMAVMERLLFLDGKLAVLGATLPATLDTSAIGRLPGGEGSTLEGFDALTLARDGTGAASLLGRLPVPSAEDDDGVEPPPPGETRLRIRDGGEGRGEILLARRLSDAPATLWARVDHEFLWSTALTYANLPSTAGLCVVAEGAPPLLCTVPDPERFGRMLLSGGGGGGGGASRGTGTWTALSGDDYLVGRWSLFLEPAFGAPTLQLGVTEARSAVLAPVADFQQTFLAVVGLALLAVVLLGNHQIQQRLHPVAEIRDATEKVARREFGVRLDLESGDEFEELATSFNAMARRLGSQFSALNTIGQIDRAILSALDTETIVRTVLGSIGQVVPCEQTGLCLLDPDDRRRAELHLPAPRDGEEVTAVPTKLTDRDLALLDRGDLRLFRDPEDDFPPLVRGLPSRPTAPAEVIVAPIVVRGEASGAIVLGHHLQVAYEEDDLERVRQIADQMAVALSNARLIDELEEMNRGALTALARTIDAKSPWTAGHSERVSELAVRIGRAMPLDDDALASLRRGGLLHDIGKLGIPAPVLDKPGSLDGAERRLIESHVEVGHRILEPVPGLADTLPIVRHHHERWDGGGYPDGLAGEEIPLLARVLAVADTYDALTSKRPYRPGLRPDEAAEFIRRSAGTSFDPEIADLFVSSVRRAGRELGAPPSPPAGAEGTA